MPRSVWSFSASERRVFEAIWFRGPISRTGISELTGLGGASVTRLARELEARGLVADSVLHEGNRGQPTRPLAVRPEGAFAFGVNFSHTFLDAGLIDLTGELVSRERLPLSRAAPEVIADVARESLLRQLGQTGVALSRVIGAGFAVPGDFGERPSFLQAHAFFPDLQGRDLANDFGARMPVRVFVENDAASAALGERIHGICRDIATFQLVHIGHGVGSGLVINGGLYRGVNGNAGLIGTIYPMSEPRPSGQDLIESLSAAGVAIRDFDDLEDLSPVDCAPLRRWLVRAGEQLGVGLHLAARILDPQAIVLGGRLPPPLMAALGDAISMDAAFAVTRHLARPILLVSPLGPFAGVIGAASVCMFDAFFGAADANDRASASPIIPLRSKGYSTLGE